MAKNFNTLLAKMSPERQEKVKAGTAEMLKELPLDELRVALEFTQEQLAETMKIKQSSISKIEHQTDILVGTLRKFIEAMGGDLEIRANLPSGSVRIKQFEGLKRARA
jgi:DNA-binding Xre family transcriptional regulator